MGKKKKRTVTINPTFKWAVIACAVIGLLSFAGMLIVLWIPGNDQEMSNRVALTCERIFSVIPGAFVGLLGGRAGVPDQK